MNNLRFKLASDSAAIHGTEFNLRASEIIAFTPAFNAPAAEGEEPTVRDATIVIYSAGQVTVQESCRTIRSMLKKASSDTAEEAAE